MSDSSKQTDELQKGELKKATELLPWYAKGKLNAQESAWIATQVEKYPELKEQLERISKQIAFTEQHVEDIDTSAFENNDERISGLLKRIQEQPTSETTNVLADTQASTTSALSQKPPTEKKSILERLLSLLPQSQGQWQIAGALALSIMVIQGVFITQLIKPSQQTDYTTLSGGNDTVTTQGLILLAGFNSAASMQDVEALLRKFELNISSGPDAAGTYRLSVADTGKPLDEKAINKLLSDLESKKNIITFIAREQ